MEIPSPSPIQPNPVSPHFQAAVHHQRNLIIGILLFFILAGTATFLYAEFKPPQNQVEVKKVTSVNLPTPSPTPSPTPAHQTADTTNWKMYIDSTYGFKLMYPQSWRQPTISEYDQTTSHPFDPPFMQKAYILDFSIPDKNSMSKDQGPIAAGIEIYDNPENWSLNTWLDQFQKMNGETLTKPYASVSVDNKPALEVRDLPDFSDTYTQYTFSGNKNSIIMFTLSGNGEGGPDYLVTDPFIQDEMENFTTMLSTFKFTH